MDDTLHFWYSPSYDELVRMNISSWVTPVCEIQGHIHPYTYANKSFTCTLPSLLRDASDLVYIGAGIIVDPRDRLSDDPHSEEATRQFLQRSMDADGDV